MPASQDLKQFVRSEKIHERYLAIENLAKIPQSWQGNLLTWQIMALIPTSAEKSKLAASLKIPNIPNSEWAIISYLLHKETDESVICNCILSIAHSKKIFFSPIILKFLDENKQVSNQILYAILTYVEETGDDNFKENLENYFHQNLPNYILAKGFNAFIKLGKITEKIKNIAFSIVRNHNYKDIENTALISTFLYLGFAANTSDIINIKSFKYKLKNNEIQRLFEIIISEINKYEELNFNTKAAELFFNTAAHQEIPNFLGYGCFSQSVLNISLERILRNNLIEKENITKTILKLKNEELINILINDSSIGIASIESNKNKSLIKYWAENAPLKNSAFLNSVRNPNNFLSWHESLNDLTYYFLNFDILFNNHLNTWQNLFLKNLDKKILISQILSLGSESAHNLQPEKLIVIENNILKNIKDYIEHLKKDNQESYDTFIEQIYATTIGFSFSASFMDELSKEIPFSGVSWVFTAIALSAPKLNMHTISHSIQTELETIRQTLTHGNMEKEEYILEVTTRFQSILVGSDRFKIPLQQKTLLTLKEISDLIQNILDKSNNFYEIDAEFSDWSGNILFDRPILRWGAILQVCLNTNLTTEEKEYYEKYLREGLRVAPHVEKRWIVRALVKLDTEEAIKAVLYQALQHIDADFVEHTINELLHSHQPRAHQALIRSVSKNNISNLLKIKIIKEISLINREEILQELKNLQLMRFPEEIDFAIQEAIYKISAKIPEVFNYTNSSAMRISSQNIDLTIKSLIPHSDALSIDSKSALRTAEMILIQSKDWGNAAVDLSPIVNMHCKAVELTMRETFEAHTDAIIRYGTLSKRLESIGYAKGIVEKMTLFEDYISNLQVIRTIPYFSKFKLRKMLRAICLYRPGKRFTLDGPKAFALLLLVIARKQCEFNLNHFIHLNFESDLELFEFIKLVHSLQDSRNRAVHEGLTWEAREEIDTMRKQAYKIISTCLTISKSLKVHEVNQGDSPMESC
jgi:hypothetical protein